MHKVFISYHHDNDQVYKEEFLELNKRYNLFIDGSVDTGDISDDLDDDTIREKVRDEYLKDTTVTIVIVGLETCKRKHVDWEIFSSMYDGKVNKKSGILVINLPITNCKYVTATHSNEKEKVYPDITEWVTINNKEEYERRYPYLPDRIIDNLLNTKVKISVTNWSDIDNKPEILSFLIEETYNDRASCNYDLSRPMRRANG